MWSKISLGIFVFIFCSICLHAQVLPITAVDTSKTEVVLLDTIQPVIDSTQSVKPAKAPHDARIATRRSAIIPGWGQAYNREYWKIPIVYAALGITGGTYFYNNTWYKRCKFAYEIVVSGETGRYDEIDPKLQGLVGDASTLEFYRNVFRRARDYSVLYFLLAWGLNVVDATVFGNLKDFDVSDDLSLELQPQYNPANRQSGVSLVLSQRNSKPVMLPVW